MSTQLSTRELFGGAMQMDLPTEYGDARWVMSDMSASRVGGISRDGRWKETRGELGIIAGFETERERSKNSYQWHPYTA